MSLLCRSLAPSNWRTERLADSTRRLTFDEVHGRLLARCIPEPNSGCLLWEGGRRAGRYGQISLSGKSVATHRVAWQAVHGPISAGLHIPHHCDVQLCCNPEHLYIGTNDENHADKALKDRGKKKLTHQKAKEIHAMVASGMSHTKVAAVFGVNQSTVTRIIRGDRRVASVGGT